MRINSYFILNSTKFGSQTKSIVQTYYPLHINMHFKFKNSHFYLYFVFFPHICSQSSFNRTLTCCSLCVSLCEKKTVCDVFSPTHIHDIQKHMHTHTHIIYLLSGSYDYHSFHFTRHTIKIVGKDMFIETKTEMVYILTMRA